MIFIGFFGDLEKTGIRSCAEQGIEVFWSFIKLNFTNILDITFNLLCVPGWVCIKTMGYDLTNRKMPKSSMK